MRRAVEREAGAMRISVYAIAKDERKFCARWMDSMREADEVVVLDTGSADGTPDVLRSLGAKVEVREISPWRFDVARNESMGLVSPGSDILVCTDLDEVLLPGWRAKLEAAWTDALAHGRRPTTAQYEYVWNFNPDGSDGLKFLYEKVHAPGVARWTHPVHEVLEYVGGRKETVRVDGMRLEHHADPEKSRAQYLPLLEMSVAECPDDDRNMHYLGREYMFYGRWEDCIRTLKRHIAMPSATWRAERAASMRYIAKSYVALGRPTEAERWLLRAVMEAPDQREPALELAELALSAKDWQLLVRAAEACLAVRERKMSYLTRSEAWGARPYDLYSLGLWYTGRRAEAVSANAKAMELAPDDARLKDNDAVMRRLMS